MMLESQPVLPKDSCRDEETNKSMKKLLKGSSEMYNPTP